MQINLLCVGVVNSRFNVLVARGVDSLGNTGCNNEREEEKREKVRREREREGEGGREEEEGGKEGVSLSGSAQLCHIASAYPNGVLRVTAR